MSNTNNKNTNRYNDIDWGILKFKKMLDTYYW